MKLRIQELIDFINDYGKEYLEDGTKASVIKELQSGNMQATLEILESIDRRWMNRTREIGMFYIFTDWQKVNTSSEENLKPFYRTSYFDFSNDSQRHIPVLRKVNPRVIEIPGINNNFAGWEIY